jgi:hypothetical protein
MQASSRKNRWVAPQRHCTRPDLCLTGLRAPGAIATFSVNTYHSSFFASSPTRQHHTFGKPTLSIQVMFTHENGSSNRGGAKVVKTHTATDIAELTNIANDIADKTHLLKYKPSTFAHVTRVGMILGSDCQQTELQERVKEALCDAFSSDDAAYYHGVTVHKVHLLMTGCIKGQVSATTCVRGTNQAGHVICRPTESASTQATVQLPKGPTPLSLPQCRMRALSKPFAGS